MFTTTDVGIRRLGYTKQGDVVNNWPSESSQARSFLAFWSRSFSIARFPNPDWPFDERLGHEELAVQTTLKSRPPWSEA